MLCLLAIHTIGGQHALCSSVEGTAVATTHEHMSMALKELQQSVSRTWIGWFGWLHHARIAAPRLCTPCLRVPQSPAAQQRRDQGPGGAHHLLLHLHRHHLQAARAKDRPGRAPRWVRIGLS